MITSNQKFVFRSINILSSEMDFFYVIHLGPII